jgi:hypothetical protein
MSSQKVIITAPGPILPGTISTAHVKCGKLTCRCRLDPNYLHGPYYLTFRTLTVHYLRLATGRVSEGELLARTVDGGLYREQLKYLRLNRC